MSHCHYRGKLSTSAEIKGVFTEAKDNFAEAFDILAKGITLDTPVVIYARPLQPATVEELMFKVGDYWLIINREGVIEVGSGAA